MSDALKVSAVIYAQLCIIIIFFFFFSSRRRHTRLQGDWSSDVCSSDLEDHRRWKGLFTRDAQAACGFSFSASKPSDRKSTRLNSSHLVISYAVFCLKKKKNIEHTGLHRFTAYARGYWVPLQINRVVESP